MKRQTIIKIISRMIVSVFLLCFILPSMPVNAATTSVSSLYSNPNQSSNSNPYKFKVSDVVNSSILTSVVGCTGVVNKTAKWMSGLLQSKKIQDKIEQVKLDQIRNQLELACSSTKATSEIAADSAPTMPGYSKAVNTIFSKISANVTSIVATTQKATSLGLKGGSVSEEKVCLDQVKAMDPKVLAEMLKQAEVDEARDYKEQCFDGIAITLAKNQLTSMARSTMNWVNSGYGGNPFFVQNMQNLTYNIEKNVVETGIDVLLAPNNVSPYASDFARSTIVSQGIMSNSSRFLGGLKSDLGNFITDPSSYYSNTSLNAANDTRTTLQKAQDINNAFANDFSLGGWSGWLALTQRESNNPLGYNMMATQYLSDMQSQAVSNTRAEISQNNGFMSQKECFLWDNYDSNGKLITDKYGIISTSASQLNKNDKCDLNGWKVTTPGSLIKDKVTTYLNSPERQLELVKTINDSLNALFSVLISKLQSGGLASLSDSAVNTNWTDNMNTLSRNKTINDYNDNGSYDNFNLTRDLGNTYIHDATTDLGTWNATTNIAKNITYPKPTNTTLYPDPIPETYTGNIQLYPNNAPEVYDGKGNKIITGNVYYKVTTAGKTELIKEGYNRWEIGDRAFWDGSKWQNWKKNQKSPIAKRGVIQIQEDYIVSAKEMLGILPSVMTSLGELDYCIPGPNPSYKTNSSDAQSAYQDWIGTIYTGPLNQSDLDRLEWKIDREDSSSYKTLANIFDDNTNVWKAITNSNAVAFFLNYFGPFTDTKNEGTNSYVYKGGVKYDEAVKIAQISQNYTNNNLFQNFYEVFDKMMNKIYYNNMTREYNDTETSIRETKNPSYIPMAQDGLDLTKDILYYNDETNTKIQDYTSDITQAKINIAKLTPIRDEVSGIIKAAQDRRDANLIKILNAEAVRTGGKVLTAAQYKTKYAECLTEEDIQVFDADGIIGRGSKIEENCSDEIDNDFNGLTDINDPACPGYIAPATTRR